jgi:3-oxosteroid 1-dehydrogenase
MRSAIAAPVRTRGIGVVIWGQFGLPVRTWDRSRDASAGINQSLEMDGRIRMATVSHNAHDVEIDVLIVGSGAGGMTAALTAKAAGLDTLVIEKSQFYGGTTALSGGGIWAPNAPAIVRRSSREPPERVLAYLEAITDGEVSRARLRRFVDEVPAMLGFLESQSPHMVFEWKPRYPDYHPKEPGGSAIGRSINALHVDLRKLGADEQYLQPQGTMAPPQGTWITPNELEAFYALRRSWGGKVMLLRLIGRMIRTRLTGERIGAIGQALVARLRLAIRDAGIPLWLDSPMRKLIVDAEGRVLGAEIDHAGAEMRVRARGGVILATGGFDHNLDMRKRYEPVVDQDWSMGSPDLLGDGIRVGEEAGAALDLMDDAWWMPGIRLPSGQMGLLLAERMIPGQFIVNGAGKRFVNEAAPYTDFGHAVIAGQKTGVAHIPAWLIIDDKSWRQYVFCGHLPLPRIPAPVPTGPNIPQAWLDAGIVALAGTWEGLAAQIDVPSEALIETAMRFNGFARAARDDDFHRGESAYDNYYGDPRFPNPNLREVDSPPYFAFRIFPGDLGTKGGLVTDEDARVLRRDSSVIPGLYAVGNASASVMGRSYAGPGATIAPAMTFGYVAANHIGASCKLATKASRAATKSSKAS